MADTGTSTTDELSKTANDLLNRLTQRRSELAAEYRSRRRGRNVWQTFVIIATSASTAMAGYLAQDKLSFELRLTLAIIVAVAGALATIRDAWQVNEVLSEVQDRFQSVKSMITQLEGALIQAGRLEGPYKANALLPAIDIVRAQIGALDDPIGSVAKGPAPKPTPA